MTATLEAQVTGALDDLGDHHEKVAARLAELGHLGEQRDTGECPVARYLTAALGVKHVVVAPTVAFVFRHDGSSIAVRMPAAAGEFVRRFDAGEFPDLVAPLVVAGHSLPGGDL